MIAIEHTLGILPMINTDNELDTPVVEPSDNPEDPDFDYARANLYQIIENGKKALNGALRVADANEKSRDYEVIGGLLKNLADVNKQLLDLNKQKADIKIAKKGISTTQQPQIGTQNNAIFVGSSSQLNELIKKNNIKHVENVVEKNDP